MAESPAIEKLEERFFEITKQLVDAWSGGGRKGDLAAVAHRHGLDVSLVEKIYEDIRLGALRLVPAIAVFESYAEAQGKRKAPEHESLDLANNENPLGPSPSVIEALRKNLDKIGRYPDLSDLHLRRELARELGPPLRIDHLVLGRGVNHLLSEIAFSFLAEGDRVAICERSFPVYREMVKRSGGTLLSIPLGEDYAYDVDAICRALEQRPRILFLGSPNNPTGVFLAQADFDRILRILPYSTLLVLDECYRDFADVDAPLPATFEAVAEGHNVISLRSFSKAYGLAGLRAGYAVARPEIAGYLEKRREPYHAGQLVTLACLEALKDSGHVRESVELVRRGRVELARELEALGLEVWPSQGNFLLFRALPRGAQGDAVDAAERITGRLETVHAIKIRNLGKNFNVPGHLRVTVGRREDNHRFIQALESVLADLDLRSKA
jgi:histidinol-phosphate aminotransferase